jgi:hypothetical protein
MERFHHSGRFTIDVRIHAANREEARAKLADLRNEIAAMLREDGVEGEVSGGEFKPAAEARS